MSEIDLDKKVTFESETGQFGGDPDSDIGDRQFHYGFWYSFLLIVFRRKS